MHTTYSMTLLTTLLVSLSLSLGVVFEAQAKRLGGGLSFGGKPAYSTPFQRAAPRAAPSRPSPAHQANAAQRSSLSKRGGLMGMLGGLALGGLLGAMFFGGAFENFNFFDLLVLGALAFLLYKLFVRRQGRPAVAAGPSTYQAPESASSHAAHEPRPSAGRGVDTDLMFGNRGGSSGNDEGLEMGVPAGFDVEAFLEGAKRAYRQMQEAWDRGDVSDLRGLTSDGVFAELQDQIRARDGDSHTELVQVEARLLGVSEEPDGQHAVVMFNVLMREDEAGGEPHWVREVWHFTQPKGANRPTWFLDGIQQVEA